MLAVLKGLPLAYQRDLQEDKAPLFESVATYAASLGILAGLLEGLAVDRARMRAAADEGFITATAVADELVRRGIPFRTAHHIVGRLVGEAEEASMGLGDLDDAAFNDALTTAGEPAAAALAADPGTPGVLRTAAAVEAALASCDVIGGTAPARVAAAIGVARQRLGE
jgi:argininosuccinate lyase